MTARDVMARFAHFEGHQIVVCNYLPYRKVSYRSRDLAQSAADALTLRDMPAASPYLCRSCSMWHLATIKSEPTHQKVRVNGSRVLRNRKNKVFTRDGGICQICGDTADRVARIVSRLCGGGLSQANLAAHCELCEVAGKSFRGQSLEARVTYIQSVRGSAGAR